ncbi:type I polyketide synthase [Longispora albida]|uniref:type I polyketide synthase n=1 Tax=Longispora albida TaxID=203523 RepID=UPI000381EBAB|nr:type I polyketide synthase [Longispora albida]
MADEQLPPIAVLGVAGRFPGTAGIADWWAALRSGKVLTRRYSDQELAAAAVPAGLAGDPAYVPVRGHLDGAECFDSTLFRVSPREAAIMDPQHRLMLETAWAALEDAGISPLGEDRVTAVFASATSSGYLRRMVTGGDLDPDVLLAALHGNEPDFIASRIAYKLGLTGPAMAVQTACSSSLVAVHLAIQSLRAGDCEQAIVVAAGHRFPQTGHLPSPGGIFSASGSCRPFDALADGIIAGSGAAAVVLRPLDSALEAGFQPYGVILGTAINNDGTAKAGYHAPSLAGQEAVIRSALRAARAEAGSVGYLETHGTGTRIGDPIEWQAATAALRAGGAATGQIPIGALKANMGHLDAAAGLAALIKALLVVREGVIPPVAGFTAPNPLLDKDSPLRIPAALSTWTGPEPRRAGVSAFGIGGTNAHVIIEQPPAPVHSESAEPDESAGGSHLIVVSAADPGALSRTAEGLARHLEDSPAGLADVAHTLAAGRAALPERLAVAARNTSEAARLLLAGPVTGSQAAAGPAPAVFLFPGQGTQFPGMGLPFLRLPGFAEAVEDCLSAVPPALAAELRAALLDETFPAASLDATALTQPALFTLGYSAAMALAELGLEPVAVAGHSLGEITAACVAGILDPDEAIQLVVARGAAMQACQPGAMLALACDEATATGLVTESSHALELAAINGPAACVLAGRTRDVEAFARWLDGKVPARRLRTSHAFHTQLIEPALGPIRAALAGLTLYPAAVPLAANLTGEVITAGTQIPAEMFAGQARSAVRFGPAVAALARLYPAALAVEVGPGTVLSALAEQAGMHAVPLSPGRAADRDSELLSALGTLWTFGQPVSPLALCPAGRRIHLPGYSFTRQEFIAPETALPAAVLSAEPAAEPEAGGVADVDGLLAEAWAELLGHTSLGPHSDFFELGGDSLLVTRLARRLHQRLGVMVPIRDMLVARTLGGQAEIVAGLVAGRSSAS